MKGVLIILGLFSVVFISFTMQEDRKVVFFGDSITQAGIEKDGYITQLKQLLKDQDSGNQFELIGAGISGNKVPDLERRIDKDVLSKEPDQVFIYIGINDVWHFSHACCKDKEGGTSKEQFKSGLTRIIAKLKRSGAEVVLCTPTVIGEKKNNANPQDEMLDEYAQITRDLAKEHNVPLCDLRAAFKAYLNDHNPQNLSQNVLTYDGVHLNEQGNALVAAEMLPYLNQ